MKNKFNIIKAIAKIAFKESIRDKILNIFLIFGFVTIVVSLLAASISLDQDKKILIDFSLSGLSIFGLIITIFSGANLVHKEIDKKTIYFIFSKPVNASELVLGKFSGLAGVLFIIYLLFSTLILASIKIKTGNYEWILLEAVWLNYFENLIILSIVMVFSSFASPIASSVYTFLIYLIGHSSQIMRLLIQQSKIETIKSIYQFFYYLMPNLQKFNIRNDIVFGTGIHPIQTTLILGYGLVYILICLILSAFILSKREY